MKLLFGSLIVSILLVLYVMAVMHGIAVANCLATTGCTRFTAADFNTGYTLTLTTVGGLVSALVIAVLAATTPNGTPGAHLLSTTNTPLKIGRLQIGTINGTLTGLIALYILTWVFSGLAAFVVGVLLHPGTLQPLTDLGQAWLGIAASAAYAYFGIQPPTNQGDQVVAAE